MVREQPNSAREPLGFREHLGEATQALTTRTWTEAASRIA